jgi:ABC-type transport system involved in multi-copper enzyme maturation permease subunit
MKALLKKDFRLFLPITLGSIALFVMIYAVPFLSLLGRHSPMKPQNYYEFVFGSAMASTAFTGIMAIVYGASAFALERRDRSADFMAALPIPRIRIVLSKFITIGLQVAIFWLIHSAIAVSIIQLSIIRFGIISVYSRGFGEELALNIAMAMMAFGIAWLLSTFLNSAAIAFGISIAVSVGIALSIAMGLDHSNLREEIYMDWVIMMVAGPLGIAAFISGAIYYLRRVAP